MPTSNKTIQGLWIGPELSVMEQLSIASFLKHGHDYHLFVYQEAKNVPAGATVKDAREILPSSMIFKYREFDSYAGFSNFFRYKLLLEHGGWWADTDMVCLKAFDFEDDYVFASEMSDGREVITSGIIKAPAGSEVMNYAWEACRQKKVEDLIWGETGPRLMEEAVRRFKLEKFRHPPEVFCPIGWSQWDTILEANIDRSFSDRSYALHLWNEMWRRSGVDKNEEFDSDCLYQDLKKKYLTTRASGL